MNVRDKAVTQMVCRPTSDIWNRRNSMNVQDNGELQRVIQGMVAMMRCEGYDLDFSMESLELIDARIEEFRSEGQTGDSMPSTMTALGIYVGEVLCRRLGRGEWVEQTDVAPWLVLKVDHIVANTIGKCMKRLDNGPTDSVKAFAEYVVALAENGPGADVLNVGATDPSWVVTKLPMCSEPGQP